MASTRTELSADLEPVQAVNTAPSGFDPARDLPAGFIEFLLPFHRAFTPRQRDLIGRRAATLEASHTGQLPDYLPSSRATSDAWQIELPAWCLDQRNQMTGPADDAELVVKMLNSGAPGVMLDLEDSMANSWPHLTQGITNILAALRGKLSYFDRKRDRTVAIKLSNTVISLRPRGLHIRQARVLNGEMLPASVFDVALIAFQVKPEELNHPLTFYIPKSESAEEALWWRDLFRSIARAKGWPQDYIKCMALVESHPLAYQMEEFAYNLRDHLLALNLGRWDYMASLIHFNLHDPNWVLPDRNTIPHDVPFFQNLRNTIPEICHKHGMLAIGGMTALYPSREDAELNARALAILEKDKRNEATSLMDGAWTGHPDQNEIAVRQFPAPNQLQARPANHETHPDLRARRSAHRNSLSPRCPQRPRRQPARRLHGRLGDRPHLSPDDRAADAPSRRHPRRRRARRPRRARARIRDAPVRRGTQAHLARASRRVDRGSCSALHASAHSERKNDFDERVQSVVGSAANSPQPCRESFPESLQEIWECQRRATS